MERGSRFRRRKGGNRPTLHPVEVEESMQKSAVGSARQRRVSGIVLVWLPIYLASFKGQPVRLRTYAD